MSTLPHPECPTPTTTGAPLPRPLPAADIKRLSTSAGASSGGSGGESDGGDGGRRAKYKQRRARAREKKINSGRALRLTSAVPEAGSTVCVDVALEKVTKKRQPRVMSDEEVERLLAMSRPSIAASLTGPQQANAEQTARTKHKIQMISDSQAIAMLSRTSA